MPLFFILPVCHKVPPRSKGQHYKYCQYVRCTWTRSRDALYYIKGKMSRDMTEPTKWAKTQISLGIHSVWSESSLCAQWVAKDPRFLHADWSESSLGAQSFLRTLYGAFRQFILLQLLRQLKEVKPLWYYHIAQNIMSPQVKAVDSRLHLSLIMRKVVLPYANKKGADQPLISAFLFRCLDNIIPLLYPKFQAST